MNGPGDYDDPERVAPPGDSPADVLRDRAERESERRDEEADAEEEFS